MEINNHWQLTAIPTSNCNNKTCDCCGEQNTRVTGKTTTKSTEQLDLCLRWQQTNHQHPYLNMCPRRDSLLIQQSSERMWISHMVVVRISLPTTQSCPTSTQPGGF